MPDRLLPALVAAMTFLAALALAGAVGASLLAQRWSNGAASMLTVQVADGDQPAPGGGTRVAAVLAVLRHDPAISGAMRLDQARLTALLAPWLGQQDANGDAGAAMPVDRPTLSPAPSLPPPSSRSGPAAAGADAAPGDPTTGDLTTGNLPPGNLPPGNLPPGTSAPPSMPDVSSVPTVSPPHLLPAPALLLPAVIQARTRSNMTAPPDLERRLDAAAPGTLVERSQFWTDRLVALTTSLQACAALALLVVTGVAVAVVAAATRAGLAARRHSIEIVHGLGAGDGHIAGRFARRTTVLALSGGLIGTILSVPLLLLLCRLGAPFAAGDAGGGISLPAGGAGLFGWIAGALFRVPLPLWIALPLLPPIAASIGWTTAQATVRAWLRRLP